MSPWVIAEVAARRARRAAVQVLYRYRGATKVEALCQAFGVARLEELPAAALDRPSEVWCSVSQRTRTLSALAQCNGALTRAISRAKRASHLRFNVFGQSVEFDSKIDWSLDPQSGHRYPMLPASELSLFKLGADPKFPWVMGRLDHLLALGQGYWVSEDPAQRARYAQLFVDFTRDFIRSNPVGVGIQWSCAMEVALRAGNLAQSLMMFSDAAEAREPAFVAEVLGSISDHCFFVEAHKEDTGRVPNNHLVSNHVGLLVASLLFPELPGAVERIASSVRGVQEEMRRQVLEDGWSFEGSVPYHRLALELFALAHVVTQQSGVDLGHDYSDRLSRMFQVALNYTSADGLAPQLGDNDSGRVFPLCDRQANDQGYLASFGAALFGDGALKPNAELCDEAVWLLGKRGLSRFARLPSIAQQMPMRSDAAGIHVLRSEEAVVTISAGANGQRGIGGHSHNDKLSFELHVHGVPVIVDPGTGTYTRDPAVRNAFRSTRAHATVEVDGQEQAPLDSSRLFFLEDRTGCEVTRFDLAHDRQLLAAKHSAFPGVSVERRFELHPQDSALLVSDLLRGNGVHTLVTRFPLSSQQARIRLMSFEERERVAAVSGEKFGLDVVEVGPIEAPTAIVCISEGLRITLEPARYSPGYGEVTSAVAVTGTVRARLPRGIQVCVLWSPRD
ncbi:MAG: alginate lyase family protein [Myxococcaceae bacterium]